MSQYVKSNEQLILEIYVKNLEESIGFYKTLGFKVVREEENFAELAWDDSRIYLELTSDPSLGSTGLAGNIRIMVPDVDRYWNKFAGSGIRVVKEIGDRYYGLRDFTIAGPDGIGVRFGTRISRSQS